MAILLLATIFFPLLGAVVVLALSRRNAASDQIAQDTIPTVALAFTLLTMVGAVILIGRFPADHSQGYAVTDYTWLSTSAVQSDTRRVDLGFDIQFHLGLDGLSVWLFGLSALLMITAVLVSWKAVKQRVALFYAMLLLLEFGCLGVFAARDIILFYVFFEFTLIPLFFLIGIWGSEDRRYAAAKFFLFTLAGSLITFLGLLAIVFWGSGRVGAASAWRGRPSERLTFSIPKLTAQIAQTRESVFRDLDAGGDGLSADEVLEGKTGPARRRAERLFQQVIYDQLDRDGNGEISDEEFLAEAKGDRRIAVQQLFDNVKETDRTQIGPAQFAQVNPALLADLPSWRVSRDTFLRLDRTFELIVFLALLAGFAIKVPLVPVHTWLPLAHVQAPTAGSVFLAGILLKIGTYGIVRFNLMMLPGAAADLAPWLLAAAVVGIIYGALVALAQTDMKRLIAYSSVSHMGFCILGLFALNPLGMQGGTLQMINHGLSTGALFALVGMIYERYHTRRIRDLGGLTRRTPLLAMFMVFFTMSSIGLPGLNGFAGEFLLLLGIFQKAWTDAPLGWTLLYKIFAVGAVSGVVLGAWYMLWLVQRVFFGPLKEPGHHETQPSKHEPVADMSIREVLALAPLAVFVLWIGLVPRYFLDRMAPTLQTASPPAATAPETSTEVSSSVILSPDHVAAWER